MDTYMQEVLWIVIVGYIIAFILALAIGANDVANSFGTSVGSGALTLKQACILASIFEVSGAVLIGYKVSDTMRKGIIDVTLYEGFETQLMLGCLSALAACAIWLFFATYFGLPVSTTHSIVGATVGFALVCHGLAGVNTSQLLIIVASWFVSPILSGIISGGLFLIIRTLVLNYRQPFVAALIALPIIYGITVFINIFTVLQDGSALLKLDNIATWQALVAAIVGGLVVGVGVHFFGLPYMKRQIARKTDDCDAVAVKPTKDISTIDDPSEKTAKTTSTVDVRKGEILKVNHLFSFLQVLTACFGSFVHGGNDVSNAIAPLVSIWLIYSEGSASQKAETPIYMLVYGGIGIAAGLWIWGQKVIDTIGKKIAQVTSTTGFIIEIGSACTVLVASKSGIPVSTTHCQVGSVVFVGLANSRSNYETDASFANPEEHKKESVNWGLFRTIFAAWVITLPATGGVSALLMWILSKIFL